ncbi:MAG: peptidoglycan D,D-transpeptidase FtsI family protein [Hyphomicrobiaceae bacterium]
MSRAMPAPSIGLYLRGVFVAVMVGGLFLGVAVQLVRLSLVARTEMRVASAEPIGRVFSRPDILDRGGRLVATDVAMPSLYADPAMILDLDEVIEKLLRTFPDLDAAELRKSLGDRTRRFAWIKRGLAPLQAQRAHDLGLPGLAFRQEPKRVYPAGALLGHLVGYVNVDNKGAAGIERHIDDNLGIESVLGAAQSRIPPVGLSIDLGVQQALASELKEALTRYQASGAAGLVMDVTTGELVAAVSLPELDPEKPVEAQADGRLDRLSTGVYELGSIFKILTVAMALDEKTATLDKVYDVREPLKFGQHTINDLHPLGRPLSMRDVFIHSSNVGAGMIALEAGSARQIGFLSRFGLLSGARTEVGPVAAPIVPKRWGEIETVTIAYGHGLATTPVHFSAAVAALVNGGTHVTPTALARRKDVAHARLVSAQTSASIRDLLRLNVTSPHGTGRRAEVAGYRVGGKTGTAEMPGKGGYQRKAVISSFVAAFPMDAPRFLTFVSLFEPRASEETKGQITAGLNAAPLTGRLIARVAPLLDVLPDRVTQESASRVN